jgi:lysophospholipase L1-like esterase
MPQLRIFLDGGSTTYGYGDLCYGGWGAHLKAEMMQRSSMGERPTREIINLALSCQTIEQIVLRLPGQVGYGDQAVSFGIFMLGAAEAAIGRRTNRPKVPLSSFETKLQELGDICVEHEVMPMFVGYHDVDEARTNPQRNGDVIINDNIHAYNSTVERYANAICAPFVDPSHINQHPYDEVLCGDGLHPNQWGHELIYGAILPQLDWLIEESGVLVRQRA